MNDAQPSGANGGLKPGALSPDELDKFAALFVPTWDQPADAAAIGAATAGAIPPPPDDVLAGPAQPAQKNDPKRTQMGIAAPMQPPPEAAFVPPKRAAVDPMGPTSALDLGAVAAQPAVVKPRAAPAPSIADQSGETAAFPKKRSPLPFVIGGGVVVAAVAIFFVTRGPDAPPPQKDTSAPTVESKKLDLPDPNSVSTGAAAANTTTATTATAAATTATATATETATAAPAPPPEDTATAPPAKTAEPIATATAAPKPTAPPPTPKPTMTAAPKPPPPATATPKPPPTKKTPQKIKDEF